MSHPPHGHDHAHHPGCHHGIAAAPPAGKVLDPVCGMTVDPAATAHHAEHGGETFHFCSAGCRTKFVADPDRYLHPESRAAEPPPPPGTIYTCPMHPEVRQEGPGACPICGMALEPELVTAEAPPNHELIDFTRRFWIGLALTVPVFVIDMGAHMAGIAWPWGERASAWI
ncbi:MAG TPA: heavy metal-binding domain-containing protein, partial [Caulobacteraceae bacterium]|nr:heavy metal-binding domain-containing protein [Caulobacteraceae bacterium]